MLLKRATQLILGPDRAAARSCQQPPPVLPAAAPGAASSRPRCQQPPAAASRCQQPPAAASSHPPLPAAARCCLQPPTRPEARTCPGLASSTRFIFPPFQTMSKLPTYPHSFQSCYLDRCGPTYVGHLAPGGALANWLLGWPRQSAYAACAPTFQLSDMASRQPL